MSWLYLPEQVEDCWPRNGCLDGERCVTSKTQSTLLRVSKPESERVSSMTRPSGTMSKPSTESPGVAQWISSLLDSRASPGQPEVRDTESTMTETYGLIPFVLLMRSDQLGFYWKTLQGCFSNLTSGGAPPTYNRSSDSWPSRGTWDNGAAYPLPELEPRTNGDGCGLLPTPVAREGQSFYVVTAATSQRIMRRTGSVGRQLHWMQYGVIYHGLKKGWANPQFSEMMMGWPIGWTDLGPLAKDKFQQWSDALGNY